MPLRLALIGTVFLLLAACGTPSEPKKSSTRPVVPATPAAEPVPSIEDALPERAAVAIDTDGTYLAPNARDLDGTPAYVHFVREQMPLRVAIEFPRQAVRDASRAETRDAVVDGVMLWQTAMQPHVPWFEIEIVEDPDDADVEIEWKRRLGGDFAGWGGLRWDPDGTGIRVTGSLVYTIEPCLRCLLHRRELHLLIAHEFGHVLGLGHCLDCDSAMNYSWHLSERIIVSNTDVETLRALLEIPNGTRVDGNPLSVFHRD